MNSDLRSENSQLTVPIEGHQSSNDQSRSASRRVNEKSHLRRESILSCLFNLVRGGSLQRFPLGMTGLYFF